MSAPRDHLESPQTGYPAYGAVHGVFPNEELRGLLFDAARTSDYVFLHKVAGEPVEPITWVNEEDASKPFIFPGLSPGAAEVQKHYDPRKFYRIFDIETLGVSVVEMDPSAQQARRFRTIWENQDIGAVENEARNEIGRRMPNIRPRLFFDRLIPAGHRLPQIQHTEVRQKLAIAPNPGKQLETLGLLNEELDIITHAIRRRLKQYTYPWDLVPHLTFMAFRGAADAESIATVTTSLDEYLAKYPFNVALEGISFRHKVERSRPRR